MNPRAGGSPAALREVLRAVRRRRGLLAAGLAAAAVATALPGLAPPATPGVVVLVAARDLPAGTVLQDADVARVALPEAALPDGALTDEPVAGRLVAGAVRRGEPLTDVRLLGAGLLDGLGDAGGRGGQDGLVASPVRLADPAGAALVTAGDRVDVLAAAVEPEGGRPAVEVVVERALVLAVPDADAVGDGAVVVVAVAPAAARALAAAATVARLSLALRSAP